MPRVYTTIEYNGQVKSLADWGISKARMESNNQSSESFGFDIEELFDVDEDFLYGEEITVRVQCSQSNSTDGKIIFIGYRVQNVRECSAQFEKLGYKFAGIWDYFFNCLVFQQFSNSWNGVMQTPVPRSQVVLGQAVDGTPQGVAAQIAEIVNYVSAQMVVETGVSKIQLGAGLSTLLFPMDAVNNITCGEAIRKTLRWIGSASVWIDYTTTPPTLNCKTRDQLTAVNFPATGNSGVKITRRDDLIPPAIHLKYRVQVTSLDLSYTQILDDIACDAGYIDSNGTAQGDTLTALQTQGKKFGVIMQTFDFEGPVTTQQTATIETKPFAPDDLNWWKSCHPDLNTIDSSLAFHPDNSLAVNSGSSLYGFDAPLSDSRLTYVLTKGNLASWMAQQTPIQDITVTSYFQGKYLPLPDGRPWNSANRLQKNTKITLCSLPSGTYHSAAKTTPGEPIPFGLAKAIWDVEKMPQYQGTLTLTGEEISGTIGIGNALNLTGSRAEWETMQAQIQQVSFDFETGTTTVSFGPANHLGAGDLIERLRVNRGPRWFYLIGNNRTNQADNSGDIGKATPKENSTTAEAVKNFQGIYETDNINASGNADKTGAFTVDATTREIKFSAQPQAADPKSNYGTLSIKLADLDPAPGAAPTDPMVTLNGVEEAKKRNLKLQELMVIDKSGKIFYIAVPASSLYSKTSDDGNIQSTLKKQLEIFDIQNDYCMCYACVIDINGVKHIGTVPIYVAKPPRLRRSLTSENIDGATITYSYIDMNTRTSNDGINTQIEVIHPRYNIGDVIYATLYDYTGVFYTDPNAPVGTPKKEITLMEDIGSHYWLRSYYQ